MMFGRMLVWLMKKREPFFPKKNSMWAVISSPPSSYGMVTKYTNVTKVAVTPIGSSMGI